MEVQCVECKSPATGQIRNRPVCNNCKLEYARKKVLIFNDFAREQRKSTSVSVVVPDLSPSSIFTLNCAADFSQRSRKQLTVFCTVKNLDTVKNLKFCNHAEFQILDTIHQNLITFELLYNITKHVSGEIIFLPSFSEKVAANIFAELLKGNGENALKIGREAYTDDEKLIGIPGALLSCDEISFAVSGLPVEFDSESFGSDPFILASLELINGSDGCVAQSIQRSVSRIVYNE